MYYLRDFDLSYLDEVKANFDFYRNVLGANYKPENFAEFERIHSKLASRTATTQAENSHYDMIKAELAKFKTDTEAQYFMPQTFGSTFPKQTAYLGLGAVGVLGLYLFSKKGKKGKK